MVTELYEVEKAREFVEILFTGVELGFSQDLEEKKIFINQGEAQHYMENEKLNFHVYTVEELKEKSIARGGWYEQISLSHIYSSNGSVEPNIVFRTSHKELEDNL